MEMTWARHVAYMGDTRNSYKTLDKTHEVKRPLGSIILKWT
jgi:hypothetical protein